MYGEIEKEFLKFFPKEDLDKINNMIKKHEKELNIDNKNLIKAGFNKRTYMSISLSVTAVLTTISWLAPLGSLAIGTAAYPIINDNVTKSNIKDKFKDIINTYEILRWNYIKMNLQTIKKKAEIYNDIINKFSQYIVDFKKNYLFD